MVTAPPATTSTLKRKEGLTMFKFDDKKCHKMPAHFMASVRKVNTVQPGQPQKTDYEYERNGVAHLFMF